MKKPLWKKRFALPVVVAVGVHATLLLGFRHPVTVTDGAGDDKGRPIEWKFPPADPVEVERKTSDDTVDVKTPPPKVTELPGLPDLPNSNPDPTLIPVPVEPTRPWVNDGKVTPRLPDSEWTTGNSGERARVLGSIELDRPPRVKFQISPDYPASMRHDGIEGEVLVELLVDETGRVIDAKIVRSTHHDFEGPVLRAVSRWRFDSGTRHGTPVKFRMIAPLNFSLGG